MKTFSIYCKVQLVKKPNWLDKFRKKYDKAYDLHITLKQPCYIKENEVTKIKSSLRNLFLNIKIPNRKIRLIFDHQYEDFYKSSIMIGAKENKSINNLQKNILLSLKKYQNYVKPEFERYEKYFYPHITIGRALKGKLYDQITSDLSPNYQYVGVIKDITLVIVNNDNFQEETNPKNWTIYSL